MGEHAVQTWGADVVCNAPAGLVQLLAQSSSKAP
jgi:hypothetical protein